MKEIKRELISSSNKTILCPNIIYNKEIQNGKLVCFTILNFLGCILNPGHRKIPAPDFNFYIQKDKYPI